MNKSGFLALAMALACAACGSNEEQNGSPVNGPSKPVLAPSVAPLSAKDFSVEVKTRLAFDSLVSSGKVVPQRRVDGTKEFTKPLTFIDAPFGPVLVVGTGLVDGSHASASQIKVYYMRYEGERIIPDRGYGEFMGLSYGELPKLTFPTQFTSLPTIRYESGYAGQGCSTQVANLIVLTPGKPTGSDITLESSFESFDEENSFSYSGSISNIIRDKGFDVTYSGTKQFTERYVYRNGKFAPASGEPFVQGC